MKNEVKTVIIYIIKVGVISVIIRQIQAEEYKRVQEINAHAFHEAFEDGETDANELIQKLIADPYDREDMNWSQRWGVFSDDDKTMYSTLLAIPHKVNFDGNTVPMLGIAAVATLPAYRGMGYTGTCMKKVLNDQYVKGVPLSYLHPFSTVFYRRFGYALACENNQYSISLDTIPKLEISGTFHLLEHGTNYQNDIEKVYDAWYRRYNLMTRDEDIDYLWVRRASPFVNNVYSYLYRTRAGEPAAYFTYYLKKVEQANVLCCTRFFFTCLEGLEAVLFFLKKERARFHEAEFTLPVDIDLSGILSEWRFGKVKCIREQNGMVRVIDAEKILRMAKMKGDGSLRIAIEDSIISQNNACFDVSFQNGTTTDVHRCNDKADITLNIRDFSALISGRYSADAIEYLPNVNISCDIEKAQKVFYHKPMCITREF